MQCSKECPEAAVGKRCDHQPACVAEVLVAIHELRVDHPRHYLVALLLLLLEK